MTKAKRMMQEDIKLIDLVIELLDARAPLASRNPDIESLAKGKSRLILLNKADLADEEVTAGWKQYFESQGAFVLKADARNRGDLKPLNETVKKACAAKIERDRKRGIRNRPVRAMVCGIPNVGKSTFINSYAKRSVAKTGNKPGVTKGKQWIRLGSDLELLDTPGILWPKFEDQHVGLLLALIGSIKDEIMNREELALKLIRLLEDRYPRLLQNRYGYSDGTDEESVKILEKIAVVRGCITKGGQTDWLKAAEMVLENFRNGKLGRISLERPPEDQGI